MTTLPADRRPAPGDCKFCNWSPDAAHANVPGDPWEYVSYVDPGTWLCPACGMPNADVPGAEPRPVLAGVDLSAGLDLGGTDLPNLTPQGEAESTTDHPGSAPGPNPADPGPVVPDPRDDVLHPDPIVASADLAPVAAPDRVPVPVDTIDYTATVATPTPAGGPVEQMLDACRDLVAQIDLVQTTIFPALLEADVDPFTLTMLASALNDVTSWSAGAVIGIADVLRAGFSELSAVASPPPDTEGA